MIEAQSEGQSRSVNQVMPLLQIIYGAWPRWRGTRPLRHVPSGLFMPIDAMVVVGAPRALPAVPPRRVPGWA